MNKINIIGPPGSGKTTLARKLADIYDLPIVHMDFVGLGQKYNAADNKPAFQRKMKKEAQKNKWIIEGVYKKTLPFRIPAADLTLLLDYPRHIYIYRILKRRIQYHNKQRPGMSSDWKERIDWSFLRFTWSFSRAQMPKIKEILDDFPNSKILNFTNPKELQKYLDTLP